MNAIPARKPAPVTGVVFARPNYELRVRGLPGGEMSLEVWELPSPTTPRLTHPERVAGLEGRNLQLIEARMLRCLRNGGVSLGSIRRGETRAISIDEDLALALALMFRVVAPMKSPDRIAAIVEGIESMGRQEAGYWLGMAVHRINPRRVLAALRMLLTSK